MVGVYARGWDIVAVPVGDAKEIDLQAKGASFAKVTQDGASNKESDWFTP